MHFEKGTMVKSSNH